METRSGGGATWWPARQRIAAAAVLLATVTGASWVAAGVSGWNVFGALAYTVIVVTAVFAPGVIALQVIGGLFPAGTLLLAPDVSAPLLVLPMVASVLATAELLAIVARLDRPFQRDPGDDLRSAAVAVLIGAVCYGAVALVGGLPGPGGVLALGLAAGACVALAVLLVSSAGQSPDLSMHAGRERSPDHRHQPESGV